MILRLNELVWKYNIFPLDRLVLCFVRERKGGEGGGRKGEREEGGRGEGGGREGEGGGRKGGEGGGREGEGGGRKGGEGGGRREEERREEGGRGREESGDGVRCCEGLGVALSSPGVTRL